MKMDNQKNANIMIKATVLSAIILIFLCLLLIIYVAMFKSDTTDLQYNSEEYENSIFYKNKDKIYALVYGNGLLEVEGVDIPTFLFLSKPTFPLSSSLSLSKALKVGISTPSTSNIPLPITKT